MVGRRIGDRALQGGVAALLALSALGCNRMPEEMQALVDRHIGAARQVAESAASDCAAVWAGPEMRPSPAEGTPLASSSDVLNVDATCFIGSWTKLGGSSTGTSFLSLRPRTGTTAGEGETYWLAEGERRVERVNAISSHVNDPRAFDLIVQRPIPSGGWIQVTVTLRRP
jgi:hypothetical protein